MAGDLFHALQDVGRILRPDVKMRNSCSALVSSLLVGNMEVARPDTLHDNPPWRHRHLQ